MSTQPPHDVPWLNAQQEATMPKAELALHIASHQVRLKVREVTSNWSPVIKTYLAAAGIFSPAPWCAAFVTWCLKAAGFPGPFPKYPGSTWWWIFEAMKRKAFKRGNPKRGDLFVWNHNGSGHIGFVAEVLADGSVRTLEGNTNDNGSREGVAAMERRRTIVSILAMDNGGFIDLEKWK